MKQIFSQLFYEVEKGRDTVLVTLIATVSARRLLMTVENPASVPVASDMAMPVWASP